MVLHTPADGSAPGYFGVYPAVVTKLVDPDRLGRIEVRFPWLGTTGDRDVRAWATAMAQNVLIVATCHWQGIG